jgi:hypothetical protein
MRKTVFIVVIILTSFYTKAQSISQEKYSKLVDFMSCICVTDAMSNNSSIKNIDCEKEKIKKDNIPSGDSKTLDLFNEFEKLKKTDDSTEKTIIFLTKDIFKSDKYQKIKQFAEKRKGQALENIILQINSKANSLADSNINDKNNAETSDSNISSTGNQEANDETEVTSQESENIEQNATNDDVDKHDIGVVSFMKNHWFDFILLVLVFVSLFHVINTRNHTSIDEIKKLIKENKTNKNYNDQPNNQSSFNNPTKHLEDQITTLKRRIDSLEEKSNKVDANPIKEIPSPVVVFETPIVKAPLNEEIVFYKHAPHESGYFDVDNNVNIGDAVFKFSVNKNNPNLASFEIIKDNKRLILDYPNKYIKPICDELNALNQNAVDIIVTPGQVEKRENKWVIKTKAQIKYI